VKKQLTDEEILEKYREVFDRYAKGGVIDMDRRLKFKFFYQIHPLGQVVSALNGRVPPNRQSMYYIMLFKHCAGRKRVGMFDFPIRDRTLVIIPKRTIHSTLFECEQCSGFVLGFNIDFFLHQAFPRKYIIEKKVFKASLRPWLILSDPQQKMLEGVFGQIIQENDLDLPEKNLMIALKILELLIRCDRLFSRAEAIGKETVYHPVLERFNGFLERHFSSQQPVSFYADALKVNAGYLNNLVKKHSGMSVKKTISARLLMEAQVLLATTSCSVGEIAKRLGFANPNHFTSFFTRKANISPTRYRATVAAMRVVRKTRKRPL
jgi:AraC family transcriptional regulator, transcriptional activator of pobA